MDSEELKKEQARIRQEQRLRNADKYGVKIAGIPIAYLDAKISNNKCSKWLEDYCRYDRKNLVIGGNVGTGKTYNMYALYHELLLRGVDCYFGTMTSILRSLRDTYVEDSQYRENEILKKLETIPVLFIDDLGKERVSEWATEKVYDICDKRRVKNLPIVISSNMNRQNLIKKYGANGEAIVSRLFGGAETVQMAGKDLRFAK